MSNEHTADETADALPTGDDSRVVLTDWKVGRNGRLHIPVEKLEKYDIETGDHVDGVLVLEGDQ